MQTKTSPSKEDQEDGIWGDPQDIVLSVACTCFARCLDPWETRASFMRRKFGEDFTAENCRNRAMEKGFSVSKSAYFSTERA